MSQNSYRLGWALLKMAFKKDFVESIFNLFSVEFCSAPGTEGCQIGWKGG